jgi:excisionase family DNA binding protein
MRKLDHYTDEQVAKLLGVSSGTVKRWRLEGRLGFIRIGPRRVAITNDHIDNFLRQGEQTNTVKAA